MSTGTAETAAAPSVIERAQIILCQVKADTWPSSREAMAAIGYASGYAAGEIGVYWRLRHGDMDWRQFDADLVFFGGDPQREATSIAADRALDAARAALRTLREHQRHEAAALAHADWRAS